MPWLNRELTLRIGKEDKGIILSFTEESRILFTVRLTSGNTQEVWNLLVYWLKDFLSREVE